MKNFKNTFILGVIGVMCLIIGVQAFAAYSHSKRDTNSYVELVSWIAHKNDINLEKELKYILAPWDIITTKSDSLAVISWWDGSITRLWENTKIEVEQNQISKDYTDIKISFDLLAWKSWSQVVSFIWEDSSFTQNFNGVEAWVRGTIFSVDIEKDYIKVEDHGVLLTGQQWEQVYVEEGSILQISDFSLIELSRFIRELEDKAWSTLNTRLDLQTINSLQKALEEKISKGYSFLFILDFISPKYRIVHTLNSWDDYSDVESLLSELEDSHKEEVYREVLSQYQSFHSVQANNYDFYKRKIWYKKALLFLDSESEDAQGLIRSTSFDLGDIVQNASPQWLSETLSLLSDHEDILSGMDISVIENAMKYIPSDLIDEFKSEFDTIKDLFNKGIPNIDSPTNILDSADNAIKWFLDDNVGGFIEDLR